MKKMGMGIDKLLLVQNKQSKEHQLVVRTFFN